MPHKILLIDDSSTQLETLKLQLVNAGFNVETASSGVQGYQKVFEVAPDLILSEIVMPNLGGYQLCRLLKNNSATKEIPLMLLTVLDKNIDKFWGNKSGADKFISKTASFEEIEKTSKEIIEKHPVSDEYKQVLLKSEINEEIIQNQINNILDELIINSTFLNEFRDLGVFLGHEKVLVKKIFELLSSFVDYNVAGLFFDNPDKNEKNILYFDVNKKPVAEFIIEKIKRDFFTAMPDVQEFTVRDFRHEIVGEKIWSTEAVLELEEFKSTHILPLVSDGVLLGGVCFYNTEECDYPEFEFYKAMVNELLVLFKMRYLYSETEYLSVTDGLTGLYNRRHFEYNIEREFLRSRRYHSELSLALVDVDFFKKVNDMYGHQFGDYVLKEISNIISASFRKTDMIYRYGGEELAVILTETPLESAIIPLERLREKISQYKFTYNGEETSVTVSIGASASSTSPENQKDLVEYADKALYRAKRDGRNKVIKYSHEEFDKILKQ
ncbi:MAG: diguanylate cyclase [Candidatus Gastranaerophilaceae bacterium]